MQGLSGVAVLRPSLNLKVGLAFELGCSHRHLRGAKLSMEWHKTLDELLSAHGVADRDGVCDAFVCAYSEPHRRYHTLEHINHLLAQLASALDSGGMKASPELLFSALYHDFVYDPRASDNEEKSAEAVCFLIQDCGHALSSAKIREMILATKHSGNYEDCDSETKLLLDADMSILAVNEASYLQYVQKVRAEYADVPDPVWKHHRVLFLKKCLQLKQIFYSPFFSRLEVQARSNISGEIEFWS